jgi:hypothetical protein
MANLNIREAGKAEMEKLLQRAAEDIDLRDKLFRNPQEVLKNADLNSDEKTLLFSLRRVALEEAGIDVRRSRAFLRDNGGCACVVVEVTDE